MQFIRALRTVLLAHGIHIGSFGQPVCRIVDLRIGQIRLRHAEDGAEPTHIERARLHDVRFILGQRSEGEVRLFRDFLLLQTQIQTPVSDLFAYRLHGALFPQVVRFSQKFY